MPGRTAESHGKPLRENEKTRKFRMFLEFVSKTQWHAGKTTPEPVLQQIPKPSLIQ